MPQPKSLDDIYDILSQVLDELQLGNYQRIDPTGRHDITRTKDKLNKQKKACKEANKP